jgi:hypothetical protein|tara:strand:- start:3371 stop:3601 length:231 start_codon:yes stop_codon:yes gene_type:complete
MNIPKPVLSRSLQIEEVPAIGSLWLSKDVGYIVCVKSVDVLYDGLFLKYYFINSTKIIYEIISKLKFHKLFEKIND